jgi:NADH-quinone oxidoreductase subunit A
MFELVISPPVAFLIVLLAVLSLSMAASRLAFRSKIAPKGLTEPYACGEDLPDHMIQPDYSQFFPFAFYFTILHVVALMAATVPVETLGTFLIAVVYVAGGIVGLFVLYRR